MSSNLRPSSRPVVLRVRGWLGTTLFALAALTASASDHADPLDLNMLALQADPEANITDLHVFVTDPQGQVLPADRLPAETDRLVISLCARRALLLKDVEALKLDGYTFRVHVDLNPSVRHFDPAHTRDGRAYAGALAQAASPAERALLISEHDADASAEALYGGTITDPTGLAEDASLAFELTLRKTPQGNFPVFTRQDLAGIEGKVIDPLTAPSAPVAPGTILMHAGIYDDPFIFPRFFRKNVVGIVTSIPLAALRVGPGRVTERTIAVWATAHGHGRQIDHVGRSLRTQLPRFGYLNDKPPSEHVAAITRVHAQPNLIENAMATFLSPLIAHRHYDSAPDVLIYDLRRPVRFPNGRRLEDDVSQLLANAGETLLYELSYAESRQFPRATTNDKPFRPQFPYLAEPWTKDEIAAHSLPGTVLDGYAVPRASDSAATAQPNLAPAVWQSLWLGEVLALGALLALLWFAVRSGAVRVIWTILALVALGTIWRVRAADTGMPAQPNDKLLRVVAGAGFIAVFGVGWIYALGYRRGARREPPSPLDGQEGLTADDRPPQRLSHAQVKRELFKSPYSDLPWGSAGAPPLPSYALTFASLVRGVLPGGPRFGFLDAANRTLRSDADLRWGRERRGFRRLLHPNGLILTGEWEIEATPGTPVYTGLFAPGARGRVIARYSTCCTETRGGHFRSLALVAKIYPSADAGGVEPPGAPAHLITQEDIGGTLTRSIGEALLTNSPPVTPLARGLGLLAFLLTGLTLARADEQIAERQLYELAELGKPPGVRTSCPRFIRLRPLGVPPPPEHAEPDFRDEILGLIYDAGDPIPKRPLVFDLEISDRGERRGVLNQRLHGQEWLRVGRLIFRDAVASYAGDFVIHFRHPPWRRDRNDPASVSRVR